MFSSNTISLCISCSFISLSRVTKESGRTANVNGKYMEIAEIEQKMADATTSQAKMLEEVNTEIKYNILLNNL